MAQNLILPFNNCIITAGFLNAKYKAKFSWTHYGVDLVDANSRAIWGSGNGKVTQAGWDKVLGYVVVVVYPDVDVHAGKKKGTHDVAVRYCHLNKVAVKAGQKVTTATKLGDFGGSGFGQLNKWAPHLHLEMDVDAKYPNYTPTLAGDSNILKKGTASTVIPPFDAFKVDVDGDKGMKQVLKYRNDGYSGKVDYETFTLDGKANKSIPC